jgi:glycosyltransferase involved in cell wall biosynthesis
MDRDLNIKPLVTVILPTFNRLNWLLKSIDSVQKQTLTDWELLVIDDASSDGTTEKMQELTKIDSRIIYHKLPVTKEPGIAKFLNFGINNARGNYIARIDDDDQWCNVNKLQLQLDFLINNPEYVLIGGGVIVIDENEKEIYRYFENETDKEIRKKILYANPMSHPTVMFKRETALKIGGYLILEFAEDWDFFLRMGKEGKLRNFKEYFARYLMAQQNNSLRNQRGLAKAILNLIKTHKNDYPNYQIGYIINYFQYLHSFFPKALRRGTTNFLKYIKRKYF